MKNSRKILLAIVSAIMVIFMIFMYCKAHGEAGGPNFDSDAGKGILALFMMMSIDFLIGMINAIFFKQSKKSSHGGLSSKIGTKGLIKKSLVIILVLTIHILQNMIPVLTEYPYLFIATVVGFSVMEFISILENLILIGIPFPKQLKTIFEIMKKEEKKEPKEDTKEKEQEED